MIEKEGYENVKVIAGGGREMEKIFDFYIGNRRVKSGSMQFHDMKSFKYIK